MSTNQLVRRGLASGGVDRGVTSGGRAEARGAGETATPSPRTPFMNHPTARALATLSFFGLGVFGCADDGEEAPASLSAIVTQDGADYVIERGKTFVIDRSYNVGRVTIRGKVVCSPKTSEPITITAKSIDVVGEGAVLECGNERGRYAGNIKFLLRPDIHVHPGGASHVHDGALGTLSVSDGGTLRLFGARTETFGWQRIAKPVAAGSSVVELERPAAWREGDVVVLGPTGFDFGEAEERVVARVDGARVTVKKPFAHDHLAFSKTYTEGGRTAVLSERAEIANLTRTIHVSVADEVASGGSQIGASLVVRRGGRAFVDGVELSRGGQLGVLGAYPFHWHLAGDVSGQFIRNSSIHHTFQRCVTIHGTNYATVENNVCFDHLGHGFFFEQGNEVKNVMRGNLGMLSRRVPSGKGLLDSDTRSDQAVRFAAPATYWVTHPDNEVVGNVASGSEGSGFWMSFSQGIRCGTAAGDFACDGPVKGANNVFPARGDTLRFDENIAHSAVVGITWDGAEDGALSEITPNNAKARRTVSSHYWHGEKEPRFDSLQAWKNAATGIYFRGAPATFTHLLTADNGRSLFFAYNQRVVAGLNVGASEALTKRDVDYATKLPPDVRLYGFAGALIYDGPFELEDVHFADFAPRHGLSAIPFYNIGGANRAVNQVRHVTFADVPGAKAALFGDRTWADTPWTTAVRDDGSITGKTGLLVPNHPMNASAGECVGAPKSAADDGLVCQYDWGVLELSGSRFTPAFDETRGYDAIRVPVKFERIERSSGAVVASDALSPGQLTNKTGMIVGSRYRYRLSVSQPDAGPVLVRWTWQPEKGAVSPVIAIDGASRCRPGRAAAPVGSLADLDRATTTAYRHEGGNLYMRLAPGADDLVCE